MVLTQLKFNGLIFSLNITQGYTLRGSNWDAKVMPKGIFNICLTLIITPKLCALNDEFQHFILGFNKVSLLYKYHRKKGDALPSPLLKSKMSSR
jgi:hypothetical protein